MGPDDSGQKGLQVWMVLFLCQLNPSNAEATFVQSTKSQSFCENHLNPVMLVFIG